MSQERIISFFGLFAMLGFAWLMSSHKKKVSPRIVLGGLALQVLFAVLIPVSYTHLTLPTICSV